jgi:hypothetical protein
MINPSLTFQTPSFLKLINNPTQDHGSPQIFHSCAYNGEVDHAKKKVDFDLFNPLYDTFLFDDVTNEWSIQIDDNPFDSIDIWDESSFENIHEIDQDLELHNTFSNPLFQSKGVKEFNNCMHTSLDMCTFSFNDD